jgi:hypothetical protein
LPKASEIKDFRKYTNLITATTEEKEDDSTVDKETGEIKQSITFSF